MVRDGTLDAAIIDPVPTEPRFVQVVPDPELTYQAWQRRHRAHTLNHIVAVRESVAHDDHAIGELFRLFRESRNRASLVVDSLPPMGLEENRRNLEVAIAAANAQGLLARDLTVEDLVTGAIASLG